MAKSVKWVAQGDNGAFIFTGKPSMNITHGFMMFGYTDGERCEEISIHAANKLGATLGKCVKITIEEEEYE